MKHAIVAFSLLLLASSLLCGCGCRSQREVRLRFIIPPGFQGLLRAREDPNLPLRDGGVYDLIPVDGEVFLPRGFFSDPPVFWEVIEVVDTSGRVLCSGETANDPPEGVVSARRLPFLGGDGIRYGRYFVVSDSAQKQGAIIAQYRQQRNKMAFPLLKCRLILDPGVSFTAEFTEDPKLNLDWSRTYDLRLRPQPIDLPPGRLAPERPRDDERFEEGTLALPRGGLQVLGRRGDGAQRELNIIELQSTTGQPLRWDDIDISWSGYWDNPSQPERFFVDIRWKRHIGGTTE